MVPSSVDAYLLSRVIHDQAVRILATCRRAMGYGATLLLVEAILPELARDCSATIRMDLHKLMLLSGRERTAADYARLLAQAGIGPTRIVPSGSPVSLGSVEAVPSPGGETDGTTP